ncbi:MAG: SH3 domain-containing protein [Eubacterium sp.]|nr:SH3 domain-containing protein [Eubacterium sp.]
MSKICSKCGSTNFDSATICSRCGSLFNDGAYSVGNTAGAVSSKTAKEEKKSIERSSKILVIAIVSIVVIIIGLVITLLVTQLSGHNDTGTGVEKAQVNSATQQEETSLSKPDILASYNDTDAEEAQNIEGFVPVVSLTPSTEHLELKENETQLVYVTLEPDGATNKKVYWEADDSSVINIDFDAESGECTVTGLTEGKTVLWAEAAGINFQGERVYTYITIEVIKGLEPVYPEESYIGDFDVNVKTFLSMRTGPSTEYEEIAQIQDGETVEAYAYEYDDTNTMWYFVKWGSKVGWVHADYLTESNADGYDEDYEEYGDYDIYE